MSVTSGHVGFVTCPLGWSKYGVCVGGGGGGNGFFKSFGLTPKFVAGYEKHLL